MKLRFPFARGCEREIIGASIALVLGILLARMFPNVWAYLFALVAVVIFVTFIVFFRDPEREPPDDPSLLVSPADGRVVMIKDVDDAQIGEATRISIFLSLFDVHVNRSPLQAQVVSTEHHDGKFNHAASADASEVNERNAILLQVGSGKIVVRQIAGLVARRIVCWMKPGDMLERGERLGLIKFGSRVDVILPRGTQLLVKVEDVVRGGKTAIAKLWQV
jgi:phosphatidylserine decarboxylase